MLMFLLAWATAVMVRHMNSWFALWVLYGSPRICTATSCVYSRTCSVALALRYLRCCTSICTTLHVATVCVCVALLHVHYSTRGVALLHVQYSTPLALLHLHCATRDVALAFAQVLLYSGSFVSSLRNTCACMARMLISLASAHHSKQWLANFVTKFTFHGFIHVHVVLC